jgi:excisionase family DNA binding protein
VTGKGLSVKQAAEWLGWTEKCLRGRIDRHLIPHRKLGRNVILWRSEVEEWLKQLPGCSVEEALENLRNRNGND